MDVEQIADYACVCGENPLWHAAESKLYWLDIPTGRLFCYDPAAGTHEQVHTGEVAGGFTIQADGALLMFGARGAVWLWEHGRTRTLLEGIACECGSRFNDVIADPRGRVFCGTMPTGQRPGRLYRMEEDGGLTVLVEGVGCSNGMGFTPDGRGMYFTDTRRGEISLFDYDVETGGLARRRRFVCVPDGDGRPAFAASPPEGRPDGMCVDAEGCVWSAMWGGGCAVRYDPDGEEVARIDLPCPKVTSVAFGGEDLADLYITTAGGNHKDDDGPAAGALFRARPEVGGTAEFRSGISVATIV